MRTTINTVDATFPIDIFDSAELTERCRNIEARPEGTYGISSRDKWAAKGYAIVGTPAELFEWLSRARNELSRRVEADDPRSVAAADSGMPEADGGAS